MKIKNKYTVFVIYCSGEGCSLSEDLAFYMLERFKIKKILKAEEEKTNTNKSKSSSVEDLIINQIKR